MIRLSEDFFVAARDIKSIRIEYSPIGGFCVYVSLRDEKDLGRNAGFFRRHPDDANASSDARTAARTRAAQLAGEVLEQLRGQSS